MTTKKKKRANDGKMNVLVEKFPGYNFTVDTWCRLSAAGFSDDFLKCVGKLDNSDQFVKRMMRAKLNRSETEELDQTAHIILQADVSATQLVDQFEDIISEKTKATTIVIFGLGREHEKTVEQLIPYGMKLMAGKKTSLMFLDWEGMLYFKECSRHIKLDSVSAFSARVSKMTK